ncbi:MAG: hypothetical protein ACQESF_01955 [Nanobdellota archaeon]
MKLWQKGAFFGGLFTIIISILFTLVLIGIDIMLQQKGLPHMCFAFTKSIECSFKQAIVTRLQFMLFMFLVFVPVISFFGGVVGYLIDWTKMA